MAFDERQVDEVRAATKIYDVVSARIALRKQGSEFVAVDDQSLTVSPQKNIYWDFSKEGRGGDPIDWLVKEEGFSFVGAVEELAKRAGITLAQRPGRTTASSHRNGATQESDPRDNESGDPGAATSGKDRPHDGVRKAPGKNEIVKTWPIYSTDNALIYEIVRWQKKLPDGSWQLTKDGSKPWKKISQRRPSPDGDGSFVWMLDLKDRKSGEPVELMRYKGDWIRFNEANFNDWKLTERRTFPDAANIDHWYYNANDIVDELQEPKDEQRTIYLVEGEPGVDTVKDWGLLALCNTGGAKNFTNDHAEFLRGAAHVVILQDNDVAGAERTAKIAPMLKAVGVELIQALNFRDVWPGCPVKGDVKDWRDKGGGTKDALLEIVDELKPWTPEPYKSKFGAKTLSDLMTTAVRAYPWRIKGILPMNDNALLMGPSRSGKTFECLDMIFHIMLGLQFAGRKVIPGAYIYLTYEGATGFENRLRAYLKHHNLKFEDVQDRFAWLTRPPNLFASEDNVVALAAEIVEIAKGFSLPLAGIVVDTHNSATRGSSEIKSDDMNRIMSNYDIIKEKTGAPLIIIGHTNAEGRHRGNEQFFNNIETAILIERVYTDAKHLQERRDDDGAVVRRGRISKQREGDDRTTWEFVLNKVVIGVDEDGDDITSMVSVEPAQHVPSEVVHEDISRGRPEGFYLKGNNVDVFRALLKAIERDGKPPPAALNLPSNVGNVITWAELGLEYKKTDPQEHDEDTSKYRNRIKARTKRFREEVLKYNVIGIAEMIDPRTVNDVDKPKAIWYVWPTGRRVYGKGLQWPPVPKKKKEQPMILAPGESEDDLPPM